MTLLHRRLEHIEERLEALEERTADMATQADVDQLTQQVGQVATDLEAAKASLQAEIDQLASANPGLDLSALQAAIAPLDSAAQALGQLKPTPVAPPAPTG